MLRFHRGRVAVACAISALAATPARAVGGAFSIAVVPDTQNMIDYEHQRASGFPIDASELFLFAAKDAFSVTLTDFRARFGAPH